MVIIYLAQFFIHDIQLYSINRETKKRLTTSATNKPQGFLVLTAPKVNAVNSNPNNSIFCFFFFSLLPWLSQEHWGSGI